MSGINYEIKTAADLKALRDTEAALRRQIIVAKATGKSFSHLEAQLKSVGDTIQKTGFLRRAGFEIAGVAEQIPVLGSFMRTINGLGGPLAAVTAGVAGTVGALGKMVAEFAGAENKVAKLDAVLAQNGQLTAAYRAELQALANTLQDATAISNDKWLDVLSRLTQFGADPSNIDRYAEAVKNLAGILGGDIETASTLFSRALQGNFEMFARYGITVDKAGSQTERLEALMTQLAHRGGGVLEAQSKTLAGQWRQLGNAMSDLMKGVGNLIARTGLLQITLAALTGTLRVLQTLFPGLIPKVEGLENKWRTLAERADELRAKLQAQDAPVKTLAESYGEAGRALDELNTRLDESASKSATARQAALDLAEANAEAAKASIDRAEAEGRISPQEASAQRTAVERNLTREKLDAARAEQQQTLETSRLKIDETEKQRAAAQAAANEAMAAGAKSGAQAGRDALAALRTNALGDDFVFAPDRGNFGKDALERAIADTQAGLNNALASAGRAGANPAPILQAYEDKLQSLRTALASATAAQEAFATSKAAVDAATEADALAAATRATEGPKAEGAARALDILARREGATADTAAAEDATDASAAKQTRWKRSLLDIELQVQAARARGDQDAEASARRLLTWMQEYKRIWDATGEDATARQAANNALASNSPPDPARAAGRPSADRLAQIGGFVGSTTARADRAAEDTAKHTAKIAQHTSKLAEAAARPQPTSAVF